MKRLICLMLAALLIAASLVSCRTEEKPYIPTGDALDQDGTQAPDHGTEESKTFSLGYHPDKGFNPYSCTDGVNRVIFPLLYQGLFTADSNYQAYPLLCKQYGHSLDLRTYVFYLEDATFSDGTPVTAGDVVASFARADQSGYYAGRFQHILEYTVREDGGVQVQLDTPIQDLPLLLDIPIVKASDVDAEFPIGSGAYVVENSALGHRMRYRTDWWSDMTMPVSTPYIPLVEVGGTVDIRNRFEHGEINLVCADPCSDTYVDFWGDYELFDCENNIMLYLGCKRTSEVFGNENVRAALTFAIDRVLLADTYYREFAMAAQLPASPASPYYNDALAERYGYDPERFARVIAEEGMVGKEITLVVTLDDTLRLRVTKKIAEMLEAGGLVVKLRETASMYFEPHLVIGEYDMYIASTKLSPNMDLSPFYRSGGALNYGGISDVSIYALTLEAIADVGNYNALLRKAMEDGMMVPLLFQKYVIYASRGSVSDLTPARDNLFFAPTGKTLEDVYLDTEDIVLPTEPEETTEETTAATEAPA